MACITQGIIYGVYYEVLAFSSISRSVCQSTTEFSFAGWSTSTVWDAQARYVGALKTTLLQGFKIPRSGVPYSGRAALRSSRALLGVPIEAKVPQSTQKAIVLHTVEVIWCCR